MSDHASSQASANPALDAFLNDPRAITDLFTHLAKFDTPTICNALERLMGGRRAEGFTKYPTVCVDAKLPPIVGFARTAKIRAASPMLVPAAESRALRLDYYEYVASGGQHNIVVIEDMDWPHPVGAFWGELNVAMHKGIGVKGTLTSGLVRDLDAIDPDYQIIASAVGPSHAFVHVTEIGETVNVLGLRIKHNDVIHADRHGAILIPHQYLLDLPKAIDQAIEKEQIMLNAARNPDFNIAKLRQAWADMEAYDA